MWERNDIIDNVLLRKQINNMFKHLFEHSEADWLHFFKCFGKTIKNLFYEYWSKQNKGHNLSFTDGKAGKQMEDGNTQGSCE